MEATVEVRTEVTDCRYNLDSRASVKTLNKVASVGRLSREPRRQRRARRAFRRGAGELALPMPLGPSKVGAEETTRIDSLAPPFVLLPSLAILRGCRLFPLRKSLSNIENRKQYTCASALLLGPC